MRKLLLSMLFVTIVPFVMACSPATSLHEEQMTVAKAQREIKIGMSSTEVVEVLGSPNMITTDDQRRETWVYDRISTNVSSSQSGVWLLIVSTGSASRTSNQRTLTIIVKFDENSKVRDFAYRTSAF